MAHWTACKPGSLLAALIICLLAANANGTADVVWENSSTGDVGIWFMKNAALALDVLVGYAAPGSNWHVIGQGDFDGNGTADMVWRNSSTGQLAIWFMDGPTLMRSIIVGRSQPSVNNWITSGYGDFDGDGKADILWRNTATGSVGIWFMDGPVVRTVGIVAPAVVSTWLLRSVGDFDGDGDDDILWRNAFTGDVALWLTNGLAITQAGVIVTAVAAGWIPVAAADFDGDGMADVIWRRAFLGHVAVWTMNGQTLVSGAIAIEPLLDALPLFVIGAGEFGEVEQAEP